MEQNKIRKYLLYALGEILLVVIGILIALQVNNWNEERKISLKEEAYLSGLLEDMKINLEELDEDIEDNRMNALISDSLYGIITEQNFADYNNDDIRVFLLRLGNFTVFESYQGTVNEILSSGSLEIITDPEIRKTISTWEASLVEIREWEDFQKETQRILVELLTTEVPYYFRLRDAQPDLQPVFEQLLTDQYFTNKVLQKGFASGNLSWFYSQKREEIVGLIEQIDRHLTNK